MNQYQHAKDKRSYFSSLPTDRLKSLLITDSISTKGEILSAEDLDIILEIIFERTPPTDGVPNIDAETSWQSFVENYLPLAEQNTTLYDFPLEQLQSRCTKTKKLWLKKNIAAATLVFFLALGAFSTTIRARSLFASWTNEILRFIPAEGSDAEELNVAFNSLDVPEFLLPTWLPENYKKTAESEYELYPEKCKTVLYKNNISDTFFSITISYFQSGETATYEKDADSISIYEKDGVDYYIVSNVNTIAAIWRDDAFECQISGNIAKETLIKMIDSIPTK